MLSTQTISPFTLTQLRSAQAYGQHLLQARAEAARGEPSVKAARQPESAPPAVYGQPAGSGQAATLFFAQQAAQSSVKAADSTGSSSPAEQAFLDYMQKSPAERMREAILKDLGLTEEELAALPPDEREKIEQRIQDEIKKRMALQAEESAERQAS